MKDLIKSVQGDLLKQSDLLSSVASILEEAHDKIERLLGEVHHNQHYIVEAKPQSVVKKAYNKSSGRQQNGVTKLINNIVDSYKDTLIEFTIKDIYNKVLVAFPDCKYITVDNTIRRYSNNDLTMVKKNGVNYYIVVEKEGIVG